MVPQTRRALLHGAAGLLTALAGCNGLPRSTTEPTRTATARDSDGGPASGSTTDPETLRIRTDSLHPPIWLSDRNGDDGGRPTASERDHWRDSIVVDGPDRAARLGVTETVDRERVESFVAATDFASETLYVELGAIEECFRLELCRVGWSANEISTDYARHTRPYTERCEVDEFVVEGRLIRIPDAVDADDVNGYSASIGSGGCGRGGGRAEGERAGGGEADPAGGESTARTGTTTDAGGDR